MGLAYTIVYALPFVQYVFYDDLQAALSVSNAHVFHSLICQCKCFLIRQILICFQRYRHLITAHFREQDHTGIYRLICTACQKPNRDK